MIAAGHPGEVAAFITSNPGMESRFIKYVKFDDHSAEELYQIFTLYVEKSGYKLSDQAASNVEKVVALIYELRGENFGNARNMRPLYEQLLQQHSNRVINMGYLTDGQFRENTDEDAPVLE
ncbi:MAG: hypothetical protein P8171_14460 [Candidatus Thiodiazotropha sp.]